jgi:hypothetical protein
MFVGGLIVSLIRTLEKLLEARQQAQTLAIAARIDEIRKLLKQLGR